MQCSSWRLHPGPLEEQVWECSSHTSGQGWLLWERWQAEGGASISPSGSAPSFWVSCMGQRFLRGLLPLLLPLPPVPTLWGPHRTLSLEFVLPSKRPRSHLMAPPRIGTHNGTFHCDEALACALLRLLPEYRVRFTQTDLGAAGESWGGARPPP